MAEKGEWNGWGGFRFLKGVPKILPSLQLLPPGHVLFPGITVTMELTSKELKDPRFQEFKRSSYFILVPVSKEEKRQKIAILSASKNFREDRGILYFDVTTLLRVNIKDIEESSEFCKVRWYPIIDIPVVNPEDEEFKKMLEMLQNLFSTFMRSAEKWLAESIEVFKSYQYVRQLFQDMNKLNEKNVSRVLDGIMNVLNHMEFESEGGAVDLFIPSMVLLREANVAFRLGAVVELLYILLFGNGIEEDKESEVTVRSQGRSSSAKSLQKRYEEIKDTLPDYVQAQIERWLPYANDKSETGRVHALYIDWLLELPWNITSEDEKDFTKVRKTLEEDHYGLNDVKSRILEFLAIRRIKCDAKAPILCFVGPPGVGKTSLGESIARAMKRKFIRRSLGGLKDEADLRGHRRTYVGAVPGMIIEELKRVKVKNPVFMLDEVDKLGEHGKDVPAHALLEIQDPQNNTAFYDHYIDLPFDLSQVLFINTANVAEMIHETLLNRMEVIELPGYTEEEKVRIAQEYIIPRLHRDYGITKDNLLAKNLPTFSVTFSTEALRRIVTEYTFDAGMRDTQRAIEKVFRKIILEVVENKVLGGNNLPTEENVKDRNTVNPVRITTENLGRYLGDPEEQDWFPDLEQLKAGTAILLMVTQNGTGKIGFVEVSYRPDVRFDRKSTGALGQILEESIEVALSRLIHEDGILSGVLHKMFLHFHFPSGAIPKDGPSAGVQTPVALYSLILGVPVKKFFSATGEIALRRDVILPVGGIRPKLLAAERAGIKEVAIPLANQKDLLKLPPRIKENIRVVIAGQDAQSIDDFRSISLEEKDKFTVYCVNRLEEVLAIAMPNHFPPPEGFIEEFNRKLLEKLKDNSHSLTR